MCVDIFNGEFEVPLLRSRRLSSRVFMNPSTEMKKNPPKSLNVTCYFFKRRVSGRGYTITIHKKEKEKGLETEEGNLSNADCAGHVV